METRHLRYFLAVCSELHFTRAAEHLGISQPTLSQQIRVLEGELNTPLFDRIGKKIALTEAGQLLKAYATRMLQEEQNAKDAIGELHTEHRGTIRLGVLPSDLDYRLTPLLVQYHAEFPNVRLQVYASTLIQQEVLDNKLDIGITLQSPGDPMLVEQYLGKELYHLIVHKDNPYADCPSVNLEVLRQLPLLMYPRHFLGRELVEDCCRAAGFELAPLMETGSATSLLQLVEAGIGATVQPGSLLQNLENSSLRSIPIADYPPYRELKLIYRSDRFMSHATRMFIERLREYLVAGLSSSLLKQGLV